MNTIVSHAEAFNTRPVPQPGDVLASRRSARSDMYAISVIEGQTQAAADAYHQAMDMVRHLARLHGVDGWYTADHRHFVRIARQRSPEPARGRRRSRTSV